jgi:3-oxoacyl-[acyl-carrier-protein] synthase II
MGKKESIFITGCGMATVAGKDLEATWSMLQYPPDKLNIDYYGEYPVGKVHIEVEKNITILQSEKRLRELDRATLLGVLTARMAYKMAGSPHCENVGVVMGSSRGATSSLEREHSKFIKNQQVSTKSSPITTSSTFATSISQDLGLNGPSLFISTACSTGLQAIGLAVSLIKSNQCDKVLAGATESCLTGFTMAQLGAVGVLTKRIIPPYLCLPMHKERSGMVLSEGSAVIFIERSPVNTTPMAAITGYGTFTERATMTGISNDGSGLASAIERALIDANLQVEDIDLIVGHGAGTIKGDNAELAAYHKIFGPTLPMLTFHKWLTGHMLAASSACSIGLSLKHLQTGKVPMPEYLEAIPTRRNEEIRNVLITAMGFGGGSSALILSKPSTVLRNT